MITSILPPRPLTIHSSPKQKTPVVVVDHEHIQLPRSADVACRRDRTTPQDEEGPVVVVDHEHIQHQRPAPVTVDHDRANTNAPPVTVDHDRGNTNAPGAQMLLAEGIEQLPRTKKAPSLTMTVTMTVATPTPHRR